MKTTHWNRAIWDRSADYFELASRFATMIGTDIKDESTRERAAFSFFRGNYLIEQPDENNTKWTVSRSVLVPGVRTLPNGDPGYPDTTDEVEIGTFDSLREALKALGERFIEVSLDYSEEMVRDRLEQAEIARIEAGAQEYYRGVTS